MSIRTRQLRRILNDIVETELKLGRVPEYETILVRLRDRLAKWQPGTPSMQVRLWTPGAVCDVEALNETVAELHADLNDLYEEAGEMSERILLGFQQEQVERDALRCRLARIDGDIDALLLKTQDADGLTEFYTEHFADLRRVDLVLTTAAVDLEARAVRLPDSDAPKILAIDVDMISVDGSPGNLEELAPIANMIDSNANTAWLARMPYVKGREHTATVHIDWQPSLGVQTINTIELVEHSMSECDVSASIRTGGAWRGLGQPQIAQGVISYRFADVEAEAVRIQLSKQAADDYSGDGWCVFGLRDVVISRRYYVERATLTTQPIYFSRPTNRASLTAEVVRLDKDDIAFELAFVNKDSTAAPIWEQVGLATDENTKLPRSISCGVRPRDSEVWRAAAAPFGSEPINGVTYYSIGRLPLHAIPETACLRMGIGQIAYFAYTTNYEAPSSPAWEPMPTDFNTQWVSTIETHAGSKLSQKCMEEEFMPVEGQRAYRLKHYALAKLEKVTQGDKEFVVWQPGLRGLADVVISDACKGEITFREEINPAEGAIKVTYRVYGCELRHFPVSRIVTACYLKYDEIDTVLKVLEEDEVYVVPHSGMLELRGLPDDGESWEDLALQVEYEYIPDDSCRYYHDLPDNSPLVPLPASTDEHYYVRLTAHVELESDECIELRDGIGSFVVWDKDDDSKHPKAHIAVYVNGVKASGAVRFAPGRNSIDWLIYIPRIDPGDVGSKGLREDLRYLLDLGDVWEQVFTKDTVTVYATRDILSYVHPDVMYLEIPPTDHSHFTVTNDSVIINFRNLCSAEFAYEIDAPGLTADGVQVRMHLRRPVRADGVPPSISSYTIKSVQ